MTDRSADDCAVPGLIKKSVLISSAILPILHCTARNQMIPQEREERRDGGRDGEREGRRGKVRERRGENKGGREKREVEREGRMREKRGRVYS